MGKTYIGKIKQVFKYRAFTLAEVLITLGIIGVVAALTIPGLITENEKRVTVTRLQKAISVINQAYKLSFDEVGEPTSAFELGPEQYFKTYWEPYIKVLTYCTSAKQCGYNETAFATLNGAPNGATIVANQGRTTFYSMDGFLYVILTAAWTTSSVKVENNLIIVDLNGSRKPNKYGRDVFILTRVEESGGGVQPYGYKLSNAQVNAGCSKSSSGSYCTEKIRRSGWRIDNSYPWK